MKRTATTFLLTAAAGPALAHDAAHVHVHSDATQWWITAAAFLIIGATTLELTATRRQK